MKEVFWFIAGALVMRYIIINTPDYKQKESIKLDELRNNIHDLVKKYAPEADDSEIGADVLTTIPER